VIVEAGARQRCGTGKRGIRAHGRAPCSQHLLSMRAQVRGKFFELPIHVGCTTHGQCISCEDVEGLERTTLIEKPTRQRCNNCSIM
jgi:hypothetical protein